MYRPKLPPPTWWTPVMRDVKQTIADVTAQFSSDPDAYVPIWEVLRTGIADAVRAELIARDLTEDEARKAVGGMVIAIFEGLQTAGDKREKAAAMLISWEEWGNRQR